jgi:hypothetical protein
MGTAEEDPPPAPDKTDETEKTDKSTFQPRVEAEEGDPTRGDYVIGVVIAVVVVGGAGSENSTVAG